MAEMVVINREVTIPLKELHFRFSRSGGPGGQNVNRVSTRVELLFNIIHSKNLTDEIRQGILEKLKTRLDSEGNLRIVVDESRSQYRNRQIAIERLVQILGKSMRPVKQWKRTKPTKGSIEQRLSRKKKEAELKKLRKRIDGNFF